MTEVSENDAPPSRSISRRTWRRIGAVFVVLILVLGIHLHQRWHAVARLQYSLNRNYEIDFNQVQRPRLMSEALDDLALAAIKRLDARGKLGPSNNRTALHTRICSLFLGKIRSIEIYYPEKLSRDFGPSLEQFDWLEYVLIDDPGFDSDASSGGTTEILQSLSKLKRLRKLNLGCFHLDENHLEKIAALPKLEILVLVKTTVPANFVEILSRSPSLAELHTDVSVPLIAEKGNRATSDPFASGAGSANDPIDPFASSPGSPDPFPANPPDPFRAKTAAWKSSESERQVLKQAGIKLIE